MRMCCCGGVRRIRLTVAPSMLDSFSETTCVPELVEESVDEVDGTVAGMRSLILGQDLTLVVLKNVGRGESHFLSGCLHEVAPKVCIDPDHLHGRCNGSEETGLSSSRRSGSPRRELQEVSLLHERSRRECAEAQYCLQPHGHPESAFAYEWRKALA